MTRLRMTSPTVEETIPPTVNQRQPNLSDSVPVTDPIIAMHSAPGITTSPAILGL